MLGTLTIIIVFNLTIIVVVIITVVVQVFIVIMLATIIDNCCDLRKTAVKQSLELS